MFVPPFLKIHSDPNVLFLHASTLDSCMIDHICLIVFVFYWAFVFVTAFAHGDLMHVLDAWVGNSNGVSIEYLVWVEGGLSYLKVEGHENTANLKDLKPLTHYLLE